MQQKWWLLAAGVVGIALAVLLFPKPDPSRLPSPNMDNANPLDFKGPPGAQARVRTATREPVSSDRLKARAARIPGMEHLTTPEAIYSGRLSGPWTLIRRQFLAHGEADSKAWAEKVTPVVVDLRARRRDPEAVSWDDLRTRQEALIAEIKAQPEWLEIDGIQAQVDRIEDLIIGYDQAKVAEANGTPMPSEGGPRRRPQAIHPVKQPPAAPEGE